MCRDRAERAEQRKMDCHAKRAERVDFPKRISSEPCAGLEPSNEESKKEDQSSAWGTQRSRGKREQNLSREIPVPSADETTSIPISLGASSGIGVKRTRSESTALPNYTGVSSGIGVTRAHGESIVNDDEGQPGTRSRISNLVANFYRVDAAENVKICNGVMGFQMNDYPPGTLKHI